MDAFGRWMRKGTSSCGLALLLAMTGCVSVPITPAKLEALRNQDSEAADALGRWQEAVRLGNAFLESPYRKTLPEAKLRFTPEGMEFVSAKGTLPVRIRCTRFGDFSVIAGFSAQERSDGFVVGWTKPKHSRLLDNSFFKFAEGQPMGAEAMAELMLHEITHTYYHCGTVSFTKGFLYYGETLVLFRYRTHSMERLPYLTSDEVERFLIIRRPN